MKAPLGDEPIDSIEVYRGNSPMEARYIYGALVESGIPCSVENENCATAYPEVGIYPVRLRIHDETLLDQARSIVTELIGKVSREREPARGREWSCPQCKQRLPPQFTACWYCGDEREA